MKLALSIWTNIEDEKLRINTFDKILNQSNYALIKTEKYWKDKAVYVNL